MIESDKPYVVQMQMAIFFSGQIPDIFDSLSYKLRNEFKEKFVSNALIIPAPPGTPPEIPRFQLSSDDGAFQVVATKLRLDFFFNLPIPLSFDEAEPTFSDWARRILDLIFGLSISLVRIGVSTRYFIPTSSPVEKITNKLTAGVVGALREIEIKLNFSRHVITFDVNDIYHFQVADFSENGSDKSVTGIAVLRDFNNIVDGRLLTVDSAKEFIAAARNASAVDGWVNPAPGIEV